MSTHDTLESTDTLAQDVLDRIETEHIAPRSRMIFRLQNIGFWIAWGVTVILGSFAIAILIFSELNAGWEHYLITHGSMFAFLLHTLPYVWIALLGLLVLFGIFNMKHTKRGYAYPLTVILLIGIGGSLLGGILLHASGMGSELERASRTIIPFHKPVLEKERYHWTQPGRGLYFGEIRDINIEDKLLVVRTSDDIDQTFTLEAVPEKMVSALHQRDVVKIIAATSTEDHMLHVCKIVKRENDPVRSFRELRERKGKLMRAIRNQAIVGGDVHMNPCSELHVLRDHDVK